MKAFIILALCAFAAAQDNPAQCVRTKLGQIIETTLDETMKTCIAGNPKYDDLTKRVQALSEKACTLRKTLEACGNDVNCIMQNFGSIIELHWELIHIRMEIWRQAANIDDETKNCIHGKLDEAGKKLGELAVCFKKPEATTTTTEAATKE